MSDTEYKFTGSQLADYIDKVRDAWTPDGHDAATTRATIREARDLLRQIAEYRRTIGPLSTAAQSMAFRLTAMLETMGEPKTKAAKIGHG